MCLEMYLGTKTILEDIKDRGNGHIGIAKTKIRPVYLDGFDICYEIGFLSNRTVCCACGLIEELDFCDGGFRYSDNVDDRLNTAQRFKELKTVCADALSRDPYSVLLAVDDAELDAKDASYDEIFLPVERIAAGNFLFTTYTGKFAMRAFHLISPSG